MLISNSIVLCPRNQNLLFLPSFIGLYLAVFNILILLFFVSYYQSIFTRPGSPSNVRVSSAFLPQTKASFTGLPHPLDPTTIYT